MTTVLEPRAGMAVAGVLLGGLAIGGAVALVTAPLTPHLPIIRSAPVVDGLAAIPGPLAHGPDSVVDQAAFRASGQRDAFH